VERHRFEIAVAAANRGDANAGARSLADRLREAEGVIEAQQVKADPVSQDLGTIVQVIAGSGAGLALAQGVAAWLRARRGVSLEIRRDARSGSIKAEVHGIDPQTALRIVELVSQD
jgi:hypothetical protein